MQLQSSPELIRAVAFGCLVTNPSILCTLFLGMCCHLVATMGSAWESGLQAMWSPSEERSLTEKTSSAASLQHRCPII